ncbi:MAG: TauD/TfdA family dioxygenase [Pseudonocardiaceae bacterium]
MSTPVTEQLRADAVPGAPPIVSVAADGAQGLLVGRRADLRAVVAEHGAVLVRGLDLRDADDVATASRQLTTTLLTEREGFAPRDIYPGGVYSGSAWPAGQPMCMHHELSHAAQTPSLMIFGCLRAADEGGTTALADGQAVLRALPAAIVDRFEQVGWQLVRTYDNGLGVSAAAAFGSDDRDTVLAYCAANGIDAAWDGDGRLHTRQRRSAVVPHPRTGIRGWFNQIAFLNAWTMDPDVREYLLAEVGDDGLPFDTRYGDGEPIDEDTVREINAVYEEHTIGEPWQSGDLLLVDNIRMAHSREPFSGDRDVVVAMGDPIVVADNDPSVLAVQRD